MRPPEQLPDNQITPVARPVDAFVSPKDYQVARPAEPSLLPDVKVAQQVGTNSVGSYQGYNNAQQLASSLSKFNPAITGALQTGGVMLAGKIMDDNHKAAVAAAQQAEALLDAQTELSVEERAAAARKLSTQDPQAGWLMHALNPYRSWGWSRGMAYSMGQKLKVELPQLASQLTGEDYLSPDQGMSKLVKLRNEKLQELQDQYGVTEDTPSYQNYVLEPFNKGSDALTSQVTKDRVKWMDTNQPRVISNNVGQLLETSLATGRLDITQPDGTVITYQRTPGNEWEFRSSLVEEAQKLLNRHGAMAGLPGQRSKWNLDAYKDLLTRSVFAPGTTGRQLLDSLTSTVPAMGADGKQIKVNGQPRWLTLGEAYRDDALEVDMRVSRETYQVRQRLITTQTQNALGYVSGAVRGMPQGSERLTSALEAVDGYMQENRQMFYGADGQLTTQGRILEQKIRGEVLEVFSDESALRDQQRNPRAVTLWSQGFDQRVLSGDVGSERVEFERLTEAVGQLPDGMQGTAYEMGRKRIEDHFATQDVLKRYPSAAETRDQYIDQQLAKFYGTGFDGDPNYEASKLRQKLAYDKTIASRLQAFEIEKGRPPSSVEAQEIAVQAMQDYGKEDEEQRRYLYPDSDYPNSLPSVTPLVGPRKIPVSEQVDPPEGYVAQPEAVPVYGVDELDDMPDRRARSRKWRSQAIISLQSLQQLVVDKLAGKPFPGQLNRLMRDGGVQNPFDFIDAQLKFYPNYTPVWTPQEYESLKSELQAFTGLRNNSIATTGLQSRGLNKLAALSDWAYMA